MGYEEDRERLNVGHAMKESAHADAEALQAKLDQANAKIDELINCPSFVCPYEKRMLAAEAEVAALKAQIRELADRYQAEHQYATVMCHAVSDELRELSALTAAEPKP